MNALAQSDLRHAYLLAKNLLAEDENGWGHPNVENRLGRAIEALEKLCHVCQSLAEEQDKPNHLDDRVADLQLRIYKLEKALKCHANTQDAHNF